MPLLVRLFCESTTLWPSLSSHLRRRTCRTTLRLRIGKSLIIRFSVKPFGRRAHCFSEHLLQYIILNLVVKIFIFCASCSVLSPLPSKKPLSSFAWRVANEIGRYSRPLVWKSCISVNNTELLPESKDPVRATFLMFCFSALSRTSFRSYTVFYYASSFDSFFCNKVFILSIGTVKFYCSVI